MTNQRPIGDMLAEALGHHTFHVLTHALSVAAERFDQDAMEFDKIERQSTEFLTANPGATPLFMPEGARRLAAQFRRQAADTRKLLGQLQGEDDADA